MLKQVKSIKFKKKQTTRLQFDLLQLEALFKREDIDHDIQQLHRVNFYIVFFITQNNGQHTIDFTNYPLEKGSILTIRKDQIHKFIKSDIKGYMLLFTDEFIASHFTQFEELKTLQIFNELVGSPKIQLTDIEFDSIGGLIRSIYQEFTMQGDQHTSSIIRSWLHILISKLYRAKSLKNQIICNKKYLEEFIELQQLVEQNCFKSKKVQYYAAKMNCSTKTINNIIQSVLNKSAKVFINEIVITQIKRLLINTSLTINEVAYTAGFEEPSNFYKYFKKLMYTTPENFRKTHR